MSYNQQGQYQYGQQQAQQQVRASGDERAALICCSIFLLSHAC
jgi:hypothetical protein